jgi:hypothetical protein
LKPKPEELSKVNEKSYINSNSSGSSVVSSYRNSGRFDGEKFEDSLSDIVPKVLLPKITEKLGEEELGGSSGETSEIVGRLERELSPEVVRIAKEESRLSGQGYDVSRMS